MTQTDEIARQAEAAEIERCRAISEQDWEAFAEMLAEDMTHTHTNGNVDDKPGLLAAFKGAPRVVTRRALQTRVYGDIAIITGPQYLVAKETEFENQTTVVWQRHADRWRVLAFHASSAAPPPFVTGK